MCEFLETEQKASLITVFRASFSDFGVFLDDTFLLGFLLFVNFKMIRWLNRWNHCSLIQPVTAF